MPIGEAFGRVVDSGQSILTGIPFKSMLKPRNLGLTIPGVAYGLMFGKSAIVDPIVKGFTDSPYSDALQRSKERYRMQQQALRARVEYEELQRRMTRATMQLAATDPHLYNEVMAGRSLPRDAVVFGGQPRTDLMEELSMGMAQGQFEQQPTAHDELMKELGV
jgi:hypothetical protein